MTISRLSNAIIYSTAYRLSLLIVYKISYKWSLYFGIPGVKCDPPVFYVFYLHKYSHGFSNFNDIVIQFFQKTSVMTVATLTLNLQQLVHHNVVTTPNLQQTCPP